MVLNDKLYNILKWLGLIACPALAVFIKAVGPVWGWPAVDAWVTTINAAGVLIGALIGISNANYKPGEDPASGQDSKDVDA